VLKVLGQQVARKLGRLPYDEAVDIEKCVFLAPVKLLGGGACGGGFRSGFGEGFPTT